MGGGEVVSETRLQRETKSLKENHLKSRSLAQQARVITGPVKGRGHYFCIKQGTVLEPSLAPWGITMCPTKKGLCGSKQTNQPTQNNCVTVSKPRWRGTFSLGNENGRTIGRGSKEFQSTVVEGVDDPRGVEVKDRTVPLRCLGRPSAVWQLGQGPSGRSDNQGLKAVAKSLSLTTHPAEDKKNERQRSKESHTAIWSPSRLGQVPCIVTQDAQITLIQP